MRNNFTECHPLHRDGREKSQSALEEVRDVLALVDVLVVGLDDVGSLKYVLVFVVMIFSRVGFVNSPSLRSCRRSSGYGSQG